MRFAVSALYAVLLVRRVGHYPDIFCTCQRSRNGRRKLPSIENVCVWAGLRAIGGFHCCWHAHRPLKVGWCCARPVKSCRTILFLLNCLLFSLRHGSALRWAGGAIVAPFVLATRFGQVPTRPACTARIRSKETRMPLIRLWQQRRWGFQLLCRVATRLSLYAGPLFEVKMTQLSTAEVSLVNVRGISQHAAGLRLADSDRMQRSTIMLCILPASSSLFSMLSGLGTVTWGFCCRHLLIAGVSRPASIQFHVNYK